MNELDGARLATGEALRNSERGGTARTVVGVLALVGAVTSAIAWTMHLTANSSDVPPSSKPVTAALPAAGAPQARVERDALAQMFGTAATTPKVEMQTLDGLQLQGIVGDNRGMGVAIFSIDGAAPVRVRAGAQVRDGIRLVEIHPRQVVLERGGERVQLALAKRTVSQDAHTDTRQRNLQPPNPGAPGMAPPASGIPPAVGDPQAR